MCEKGNTCRFVTTSTAKKLYNTTLLHSTYLT